MKKALSLLLCIVLCLGLCIPAFAYNDDVTVSASLDQAELDYDAKNDQTVKLTVSLSKEVQIFSMFMQSDLPSDLKLTGIEGGSFDLDDYYSLSTGKISWYKGSNKTAKDLAILTVTIPAGTAAGSYKIGVNTIKLASSGENGDKNWMDGKSAYATLTIKGAAETKYKVSFDANGGSGSMDPVEVKSGEKLTLPENGFTAPDNKEFDKWDAGKPGDQIAITADKTIKAVWKDKATATYTVEFSANGGSGSMDPVEVKSGEKLTLPENGFTAPDNKEFDKWDVGKPGDQIAITANKTIKAVWKDKTYTVKFSSNGGSGSMDSVEVKSGEKLTLPENGFTAPDGKEFDKWDAGAPGDQITVTANKTIKALWKDSIPAVTYTVSFDANGGSGKMASETVGEGDYSLPECKFTAPKGQQFKAWGRDSGEYQPGDVYHIDADVTFLALWEEVPALATVRFHLNGGSASGIKDGEEVTYTENDKNSALPRPTKSGYSFNGWYDAAEGGKKYTKVTASLPADLYAQWSEIPPYTPADDDTITVSFRLIGAELATKDVDLGAVEYMPDYVTWISTVKYEMEEGSTVYDLWVKATAAAGITSVGASKNYVETVYAPKSLGGYALSEFTNGKRSGWMYTINGKHPGYGLKEQKLHDGDKVVWHYVNDYSYEVDDWVSEGQWQALGDGTYWNRWLLAADRFGEKGGGLGGKKDSKDSEPVVNGSTITVAPEVESGVAEAAIEADTVKEALKNTKKGDTLTVVVDTEGAGSVALELPADAAKAIANAGVDLRVETENGTAKLDANDLSELAGTGKTVAVTVNKNADGSTTVDVTAGGRSVDAKIKVELPAAGNGQVLVIVKPNGTQEIVKKSVVENGKVYAEIPAGAKVKVIRNEKTFVDVAANAWYKGAVDFASSHELFNGVSDTEFAPSMPMTRAMLATVLYRLESAVAAGTNPFADVPSGTWYTDAVTWANANGIVMGTDKGFEPNVNITREQIATMLFRYAKLLGLDTTGRSSLSKFTDGDKTASWASDAMQWAVSVGLFRGDENGALNPKGDATRAEVATLMQRMVGIIVK